MAIVGAGIAILCGILPVLILVMIILAVVKKGKDNKEGREGESFNSIVRTIYIYIMLIAFLCATIGGFLYFVDSAIDYYIPLENANYDSAIQNMLEKNNEKNGIIVNMYTSITVVIISLPLFIYHSKLAKTQAEQKT